MSIAKPKLIYISIFEMHITLKRELLETTKLQVS